MPFLHYAGVAPDVSPVAIQMTVMFHGLRFDDQLAPYVNEVATPNGADPLLRFHLETSDAEADGPQHGLHGVGRLTGRRRGDLDSPRAASARCAFGRVEQADGSDVAFAECGVSHRQGFVEW